MKFKHVLAIFIFLVLYGFIVHTRDYYAPKRSDTGNIDEKGLLPEQNLALLDDKGKSIDAAQPYAELLDKIETKCLRESRHDLALMAYSLKGWETDAGYEATSYSALGEIWDNVKDTDNPHQQCVEIVGRLRPTIVKKH
ncbi:MAG: hypothetical protein NVS2B14_00320 [Chamaesiphon sp.]